MRRFLSLLLVLALALSLLPTVSFAEDEAVLNGLKYRIVDGECHITGYTAALPADVVIPDEIEGCPVTALDDNAFADCTTLKSLTLPAHLRQISNFVFDYCSLGGILDLPASVQTISEYAFVGSKIIGFRTPAALSEYWVFNTNLRIVIMPEEAFPTLPHECVLLDYGRYGDAFQNAHIWSRDGLEYLVGSDCAGLLKCTARGNVQIPTSIEGVPVTMLLDRAFSEARQMTSLTLPETIEYIGRNALSNTELTVFQGLNVRYVGKSAFYGCMSLRSVTLPQVEYIGTNAFSMCKSLRIADVGPCLRELHNGAFSYCNQLTTVPLPDTLRLLGDDVFMKTSVTALNISANIRELTDRTFAELSTLRELTLHEGLEIIDDRTFDDCTSLQSLTLPAGVKTVRSVPDVAGCVVSYHSGTMFDITAVPENPATFVNLDTGERRKALYTVRQDGLTFLIEDHAALLCGIDDDCPESVVVPAEVNGFPVTGICPGAAHYSQTLKRLTLPPTVQRIAASAFSECPSFCAIELPPSVTFCGDSRGEGKIYYSYNYPKQFMIIAEAGSYAAEYAKRMGYYVLETDENSPEYRISGSHVFATSDGEATLIASVSHSTGNNRDDVVPGSIDGIPVTRIAAGAYGYGGYYNIIWNEPLKIIEDGAVSYPSPDYAGRSFTIPATATEIGENAIDAPYCLIIGEPGSTAQAYSRANPTYSFDNIFDRLPFRDVQRSAWYFPAVKYCYWNGLMNGTAADTFAPTKTTTRAMVVQVLYNIAGDGAVAESAGFTDVPESKWFAKAVNWAYAEGITSGTSATAFSPDNSVTREQVATFLYNFSKASGRDTSARADLSGYRDCDSVSGWARDAMQWCVAEGLINGTDAVTLNPRASATRAQIATILMRFCEE